MQSEFFLLLKAVPVEEHCGENFHYMVSYKMMDSHEPVNVVKVDNASATELVIHNRPIFTKYRISVWSGNVMGQTPPESREYRFGYSSEGSKYRPTVLASDVWPWPYR